LSVCFDRPIHPPSRTTRDPTNMRGRFIIILTSMVG